jgi:hypothetical protein
MGNSGKRPPRDYNPISASDFRQGACGLGYGFIAPDIAQSAFNKYDHNRKGYLDRNDAYGAYGYLHRLYS